MAVAYVDLTSGASGTDGTDFTTASFTPTSNRPVLFFCSTRFDTVDSTPTLTGNGITWGTPIATVLVTAGNVRSTLWLGINASPSAGAATISHTTTMRRCLWSVIELTDADIVSTIVQAVTATGSATTTQAATLAAFADAANATWGGIGVNWGVSPDAITQGTGFTEIHDVNVESMALETQFRADNDTSVDWSWTNNSAQQAAIAVEIKAAGGAASPRLLGLLGVGN